MLRGSAEPEGKVRDGVAIAVGAGPDGPASQEPKGPGTLGREIGVSAGVVLLPRSTLGSVWALSRSGGGHNLPILCPLLRYPAYE